MDSSSFSSSSSPSSSSSSGSLSTSDLEAGFSRSAVNPFAFTPSCAHKRTMAAPPTFFYDSFDDEEPRYFLHACFLCKKTLSSSRDIFMYRGGTPFCSEECRQEQIEMDEAEESEKKHQSLKVSSRKEQQVKQSSPESQKIPVLADAVEAW
ncbi:uncharacterized protein [Typha latifolia]|uniref:uncharacterized protein n=1 Tax=Typha latifolia TaxID=4733 RepID=UPI003C2BB829